MPLIKTQSELKQDKAQLCIFKKKLAEDSITQNGLALIDKRLEDITMAKRNKFGLLVKLEKLQM